MSSNNQGITVHPNRVFVKELPTDVDRDELKAAFSGFGLRIRTARVVETKGLTNYGFLTFDSKAEADQVIQMARSDHGILVRGKKIVVDQAFSRRNPIRRNSRQLIQAFQDIFESAGAPANGGTDAQHPFVRTDCNYSYDTAQAQGRGCGTNQVHYPFNPLWHNGPQVYIAPANHGLAPQESRVNQYPRFPHAVPQGRQGFVDDGRQSPHWPLLPGHYSYDNADHHQQRYGTAHQTYVQAHHPGITGQLCVEMPAEAMEAPNGTEWSPHAETATTERLDSGVPPAYSQHDHDLNQQVQSQYHHQTHLVQQHLAQQHNLPNAHWVQYAHYQQPISNRRDSESSNN